MKKGKSKTRSARRNFLRLAERTAARRVRQQARKPDYDRRRYDGFGGGGALAVEG